MMATNSHDKLQKIKSYPEACAAFKETSPVILINHDMNIEADAELAKKIADDLKSQGLNATTLLYFEENEILPGETRDRQFEIFAESCTHAIDISSSERGNGRHNRMSRTVHDNSGDLGIEQTRLFTIEQSDEAWTNENEKRRLIIGMINFAMLEESPSKEEVIIKEGIDWSKEEFAHLLSHEVTIQKLSDVSPRLKLNNRFSKVIFVDMDLGTNHNVPAMDNAFIFDDVETHNEETIATGLVCKCGRCGTERKTFTVDKSEDGTEGVIIITNDPCDSCGVTSNINPVPGYKLENALNGLFKSNSD